MAASVDAAPEPDAVAADATLEPDADATPEPDADAALDADVALVEGRILVTASSLRAGPWLPRRRHDSLRRSDSTSGSSSPHCCGGPGPDADAVSFRQRIHGFLTGPMQ